MSDILLLGKKHNGKKIEDIYRDDASYLMWLRDARLKDNDDRFFFDNDVHTLLDMTIREDKYLAKRFKPWDMDKAAGPVTIAEPEQRVDPQYDEWGSFA